MMPVIKKRLHFNRPALLLLLLLPACSSPPRQAVLQPVGPAPQASVPADGEGYLVVYSAWSHFVDPGSTGHHSRYILSSDAGAVSREIINHVDRFDEGPIKLPLAPGSYHVSAHSAHFGRVSVPIVVKERQTTVVYLDGLSHPTAAGAQTNTVRLPDGEIIGWSATVANKEER
jgi:hypothetical protein